MESLEKYMKNFDELYPDYADPRYAKITELVEMYGSPKVSELVASEQFDEFASLILPIIAIKNYKSQIPFPEDIATVVRCVMEIRSTKPKPGKILEAHKTQFTRLLSLQGFQLPTVSAIFHFCHPNDFPIVDVNVEAACKFLKTTYPEDFQEFDAPSLPAANTSPSNKENKYLAFISFIGKVMSLQDDHGTLTNFRQIDKALMVLGVPRFRKKVDEVAAR